MTPLGKSILSVLTFFDVQDMPLTLMEIRAYLIANNPPLSPLNLKGDKRGVKEVKEGDEEELPLSQIKEVLETELANQVETDGVFYFLTGRSELCNKRKTRYQISLTRMRKTKKFAGLLRFIPFVRAVAVSGSQAVLNSKESSDIDLFIIAAKGRIWLARLLVTAFLQALGQRRHGRRAKNRFCLNHYIEEGALISRDKNLYTAILYSNFIPVFGVARFLRFYEANGWIRQYVRDPVWESSNNFFGFEPPAAQKAAEIILEAGLIAPVLNFFSGLYQQRRIKQRDHVYVSARELAFHPDSKGQRILARYAARRAKFTGKINLTRG